MVIKDKKEDYEDELENFLAENGYKLVDFKNIKIKTSIHLKITIDKDGKVGHKDCQKIGKLLEEFTKMVGIDEGYSSEISSPGINRQLKSLRELNIFRGRKVLLTYEEDYKTKKVLGQLKKSNLEKVILLVEAQNEKSFQVDNIKKILLFN